MRSAETLHDDEEIEKSLPLSAIENLCSRMRKRTGETCHSHDFSAIHSDSPLFLSLARLELVLAHPSYSVDALARPHNADWDLVSDCAPQQEVTEQCTYRGLRSSQQEMSFDEFNRLTERVVRCPEHRLAFQPTTVSFLRSHTEQSTHPEIWIPFF